MFDTTKLPYLNYKDPEEFWATIEDIKRLFFQHSQAIKPIFEMGERLKDSFMLFDPLLQELTQLTCPYCGNPCCAQRHGIPEYADIVMFLSMREEILDYDLTRDPSGECAFISEKGCILPRYRRPYRCTWYFCDPMLLEVERGPSKRYKEFIRHVKTLAEERRNLLEFFLYLNPAIKHSR